MDLTIQIPNNNIPERTYAVRILFQHFLGLDVEIQTMEISKTIVTWSNKRIVFNDTLWSCNDSLEYLNEDKLPKVIYAKNEFIVESNIPIIYGTSELECLPDKIHCGIDVLASIFFMLTRWEEYVVKERDEYDRFIGKNSIAFKNDFLNRPVVNEYVEFVWKMLLSLGFKGKRKKRHFALVLTHDVDEPFMRFRFLKVSKYVIQALLKGHLKEALGYLPAYFKDPYDTYGFLMNVSETLNTKSHFYFMSSDWHTNEFKKSPYLSRHLELIISRIKKRNHIIGFHPGYFSVESLRNWNLEKEWIDSIIKEPILEGRQHFLRFFIPDTFTFWERNGMMLDSSLSYHDIEGFRCGTGDEFPVFDIISRCEYRLSERPLIVMDGTLVSYRKYTVREIQDIMTYYINLGRKYSMCVTFLFHNSSFIGFMGRQLRSVYQEVILSNNNS